MPNKIVLKVEIDVPDRIMATDMKEIMQKEIKSLANFYVHDIPMYDAFSKASVGFLLKQDMPGYKK